MTCEDQSEAGWSLPLVRSDNYHIECGGTVDVYESFWFALSTARIPGHVYLITVETYDANTFDPVGPQFAAQWTEQP